MSLFIFDLDGVIVSTSKNHYNAWRTIAKEVGVELTAEDNEQIKGIPRRESLERILEMAGLEDMEEEKIRSLMERKNRLYRESVASLRPRDALEGARPFLVHVKKEGHMTALASASKNAPFILERLALAHAFDYIVYPDEVRHPKPAPDIFLRAAKRLNHPVTDCVGFEDAQAGIEGINEAGMLSVGIGNKEELRQADVVYPSLQEADYGEIVKKLRERRFDGRKGS